MAGKSNARRFTEADKAAGLTALAANGGNIKRTAGELDISPVTLRRWRDQAKRGNGPSEELVEAAVDDFVSTATRIRNKALTALEQAIDAGKVRPSELNAIAGTLDDKLTRASGLPTSRVETQPAMSREEMALAMGAVIQGAIEAARNRQEVIEAEVVPELPPADTPTKLRAVG